MVQRLPAMKKTDILGEAAVSYRVSYHFGELGEKARFLGW
jgi:hypothetical protein